MKSINKNAIINVFKSNKKIKILLFGVLVLVVVILIYEKSFVALAGELIDSFTDTSRVSDTWQVEVDINTGSVKLAQRSCDSSVWICDAANICENSLGDGEYILVASTTISGTRQWKISNTACDLPECGQDGGQNGDNLGADNTVSYVDYPAREACKQIGGRLPTREELLCIYQNRASFNNNFGTANYWSSTEYSNTSAWRVGFGTGSADVNYKADSYSVRCVRGW